MTNQINDSQSLSLDLLGKCFKITEHTVDFDPWLLINEFALLRKIADKLSKEVQSKIVTSELTGICTLARSGIPLGVLLSLSLKKPLHFYFREPLRFEDQDKHMYHLYPPVNSGSNYLLVDSHIVTSYTSSSASEYIKSKGANIVGLAVAYSFDDTIFSDNTKREFPIITLGSVTENNAFISKLLGNIDAQMLFSILKQRPVQQKYYPDSPYVPTRLLRAWALSYGLMSRIKNGSNPFQVKRLDNTLSYKLLNTFGSQESEIWSLFSRPGVMQEIGHSMGNFLADESIDTIFAVGFIGTIVALITAYFSNFSGSIFTTYKPIYWDDLIREQNINRTIVTTGRLQTGMFMRGTCDFLERNYGILPSKIVSLRHVPGGILPPRNLFPYYFLRGYESKLYTLS